MMNQLKIPDTVPFTIIVSYRGELNLDKDKAIKKAMKKITSSGMFLGSRHYPKSRDLCRTFVQKPAGKRALVALKRIKKFKIRLQISF